VIINDLIVLGRACPSVTSDGRKTVCLGGYSLVFGFVRIYPVRPDSIIKRWDVISVDVERNPQDSREESWKIVDSKLGWDEINNHIRIVGQWPKNHRGPLCEEIKTSCVHDLNANKTSLGIIRPDTLRGHFGINAKYDGLFQMMLPELEDHKGTMTKHDHPYFPKLKYTCGDTCNGHDQSLLEWGAYMWCQKHPDKLDRLWSNLRLYDESYLHYLFVGNLAHQRTSYVVISVLRQKAFVQSYLFSMSQVIT